MYKEKYKHILKWENGALNPQTPLFQLHSQLSTQDQFWFIWILPPIPIYHLITVEWILDNMQWMI